MTVHCLELNRLYGGDIRGTQGLHKAVHGQLPAKVLPLGGEVDLAARDTSDCQVLLRSPTRTCSPPSRNHQPDILNRASEAIHERTFTACPDSGDWSAQRSGTQA